jgi:hypothetical protein
MQHEDDACGWNSRRHLHTAPTNEDYIHMIAEDLANLVGGVVEVRIGREGAVRRGGSAVGDRSRAYYKKAGPVSLQVL